MMELMNTWWLIVEASITGSLIALVIEYILFKLLIDSKRFRKWLIKESWNYVNLMTKEMNEDAEDDIEIKVEES